MKILVIPAVSQTQVVAGLSFLREEKEEEKEGSGGHAKPFDLLMKR
jgi:hypothetical protein